MASSRCKIFFDLPSSSSYKKANTSFLSSIMNSRSETPTSAICPGILMCSALHPIKGFRFTATASF